MEFKLSWLVRRGDYLVWIDSDLDDLFTNVGRRVEQDNVISAIVWFRDVENLLSVVHWSFNVAQDSLIILLDWGPVGSSDRIVMEHDWVHGSSFFELLERFEDFSIIGDMEIDDSQ